MRARRIVAGVIVVCLVALLTILLWPERTKLDPPSISIVRVENAGVDDDEGKEMWLVTVSICNPNNDPFADESLYTKNSLYVEDGVQPIEVRVTNRWVAIRGGLGCHMGPGEVHTTAWVVPAGADACRASLKYTNPEIHNYKWLARLAMRLPRWFQTRLPNGFWQWSNTPQYRRSSNWREINIELPFPAPALPLPKVGE
jgi:hypothetical protein